MEGHSNWRILMTVEWEQDRDLHHLLDHILEKMDS